MEEGADVLRDWDVFLFYIEMREIVFFCYTVNSRYLNVEVYSKLYISKQLFRSKIIYFEISQFEIHGIEINILTATNGYKWH